MAKGDPLPNEDHVLRGCGPRGINRSNKVTVAAFEPRRQDEYELSVAWVECPCAPVAGNKDQAALGRLGETLSLEQKVCKLNVGEVRQLFNEETKLDVLEDGLEDDPCHSVIVGLAGASRNGMLQLREQLADLANQGEIFNLPGRSN